MTAMRGCRAERRLLLVSAFAVTLAMTLSGCGPGPAPSTQQIPDQGCTSSYPHRQTTETTVPSEKPYLDKIVVCSTDAAGSSSVITNNSDVVWAFVGSGPFSLIGGSTSAVFRETVTQGNLYAYAFIAPGDTMALPGSSSWEVQPALTATWMAQDVYNSLLTKYATSAATSIVAQGSKSKAALIGCGVGFAGALKQGNVTGSSTEETVTNIFADVGVAGTCTNALRQASSEIKPGQMDALLGTVERAGSIAETATKVHNAWGFVLKLCAITHKCP